MSAPFVFPAAAGSARRRRTSRQMMGAALGVLLDQLFGEPPETCHPLRAFGAFMTRLEMSLYRSSRSAGTFYAAVGVATGALTGWSISSTALASYLAIGGRSLGDAAKALERALVAGDIAQARAAARALVGRDVDHLGEAELCRAAVESVAENTVDALVAPLLFAAAAGAPGVLGYRAVNTLDAMVGYRDDRYRQFGWASARLDDVANFLPARATALLVAVVRPQDAGRIARIVRRDAPGHPSPNAGVAEAAFAAALGVRLGGTNSYGGRTEHRAFMGEGREPGPADISRAVALCRQVGAAGALMALGLGVLVRRP